MLFRNFNLISSLLITHNPQISILKKSISIIGSKGLPAKYGGFETLTNYLCKELSSTYKINVSCEKVLRYDSAPYYHSENIKRFFVPFKANGAQSIIHDLIAFIIAARKSDIILILGIGIGAFIPMLRKIFPGKRIITHTDGIEWRREKWLSFSKIYFKYSFRTACLYSHIIITDNTLLFRFIKRHYKTEVKDIRYGISCIPDKNNVSNPEYYLTIARAEKENNLGLIAEAFLLLPNLKWKVLCNYQNTSYGKSFYNKYNHYPNIDIISANYSDEYVNNLRSNAMAYIHGHSVGGSNPTLIEFLPYNKPTLCYDTIFNKETTFNKAVYFKGKNDLIELLSSHNYTHNPELKELAIKNYDWEQIAKKYRDIIEFI